MTPYVVATLKKLTALLLVTGALGVFIENRMNRAGDWLPPLPKTVGDWTGRDIPIPKASLHILGDPKAEARTYRSSFGETVSVSTVAAGSFEAYHEPTVCMVGMGFAASAEKLLPIAPPDIVNVAAAPVGAANGAPLAVAPSRQNYRALVFSNDQTEQRLLMFYWLQSRDGTTDTTRRMGTYRDIAARLQTGWGAVALGRQTVIVRVLTSIAPDDVNGAQARRNVRALADATYAAIASGAPK